MAVLMRHLRRRKLCMHFRVDSGTLWCVLRLALGVKHPRLALYRAAVQR